MATTHSAAQNPPFASSFFVVFDQAFAHAMTGDLATAFDGVSVAIVKGRMELKATDNGHCRYSSKLNDRPQSCPGVQTLNIRVLTAFGLFFTVFSLTTWAIYLATGFNS
jgi:hypothetical protein